VTKNKGKCGKIGKNWKIKNWDTCIAKKIELRTHTIGSKYIVRRGLVSQQQCHISIACGFTTSCGTGCYEPRCPSVAHSTEIDDHAQKTEGTVRNQTTVEKLFGKDFKM
jgi:hypothetical protein